MNPWRYNTFHTKKDFCYTAKTDRLSKIPFTEILVRVNTFYHPFSGYRTSFLYMSSSVNLSFPLSSVSSLTKSEAMFFPHLKDLSFPSLTVSRSRCCFKSLFHAFFYFYFLLRYNIKYINLKCTAQLNFEKHMSMEPPSRSKHKILFNTTEASSSIFPVIATPPIHQRVRTVLTSTLIG